MPRPVRRSVDRFFEDPASMRNAAWLLVGATALAVVAGGVIVRLFDRKEYPNIGRALWFTLQTVTTVGYGDVTPTSAVGRLVGAVVMLTAIGFITVVTAAITSTFVEAGRRKADKAEVSQAQVADHADYTLAAIMTRLDRIEEALRALAQQSQSAESRWPTTPPEA